MCNSYLLKHLRLPLSIPVLQMGNSTEEQSAVLERVLENEQVMFILGLRYHIVNKASTTAS